MMIRSTEEARSNVESFTTRLLELMMQKKALDADIKALKDEFKEEGVPVGVVNSVIAMIKKSKKETDEERFEKETIREWLESVPAIDDAIGIIAE